MVEREVMESARNHGGEALERQKQQIFSEMQENAEETRRISALLHGGGDGKLMEGRVY